MARTTNWLSTIIPASLTVPIAAFIHPMLGVFALVNWLSLIGALIVFATKFSPEQNQVFDKGFRKLASHDIFAGDDLVRDDREIAQYEIPQCRTDTVLVVGAAGSDLWLEKALGLFETSRRKIPDLSMLLICDSHLYDRASRLPLDSYVSLMKVDISTASEMRSARMAPMFYGDPDTYYLHRDADWRMTPIELAAVKLRRNLMTNPLSMSPSPVLLASVNYFGSAFSEFAGDWYSTRQYWKIYGHDEKIAKNFKVDHVYNRLSPMEETLFYCSCVRTRIPPAKLFIPTKSMLNRGDCPENVSFKSCDISSYGDNQWRSKVHALSASSNSLCAARANYDVVSTAWLNTLFYCALNSQLYCWDVFDGLFFKVGKTAFFSVDHVNSGFINLFTSVVGVFYGFASGVPASSKQQQHAKELLAEDKEFGDNYARINAARASRGVDKILSLNPFKSSTPQLVAWSCAIANLPAFAFGTLLSLLFPFFSQHDLIAAVVLGSNGTMFGLISGMVRLMHAIFSVPCSVRDIADILAVTGSCCTGHVNWWSWSPVPHILYSYQLPYLGEPDSVVDKHIYPVDWHRGWVTGWGNRPLLNVTLPPTMINLRTSTFIALSRFQFVDFKAQKDIAILGSGLGGIAQAVLHERFNGALTLLTLKDIGFETLPIVVRMAKAMGVCLRDLRQDMHTYLSSHEMVICDVAAAVNDPIWWCDGFDHRDEQIERERDALKKAIDLTLKGGTTIVSIAQDTYAKIEEMLMFMGLHYSEVTIVEDPIRRHSGFVWVIGKKKLARKSQKILACSPGYFHFADWDGINMVAEFMVHTAKTLRMMNAREDVNAFWQSRIFSCYREMPGELTPVNITISNAIPNPGILSQENLEFVENAPIRYMNTLSSALASFTFTAPPVREVTSAFTVLGRAVRGPVPDREFNAGIDVISQNALNLVGCLPLQRMYDVPSQSNFSVFQGLYRRYAFEEPTVDSATLDEAFDAILKDRESLIRNYDFSPISNEELLETATKRSSLGYMSLCPARNIGDAIKNYQVEIEQTLSTLVNGGPLNLGFHASPKVEKKEVSDLAVESVPRLFVYREGLIRIACMRLFKRFNNLVTDRTMWRSAMSGDAFSKAKHIVNAFSKFSDPAACSFEAVKWDGHVQSDLFVSTRRFMTKIIRTGFGGENAARVLQSLARYDIWGHLFMCDGSVVAMNRGNKKSGEHDTSSGNKLKNDGVELVLVKRALGCSWQEALDRVERFTEGDDKSLVGERSDIEKICALRNEVYESFGLPQEDHAPIIDSPERLGFCSYGYTKLSNGICVPIRDLHEVFGKLLVPAANGLFTLDYTMASRTLTSVISLVANFWYLKEVRTLYEAVTAVVPKDVIPGAVLGHERWKFYYKLGIFNPTKFNLEKFLITRFGRLPYDGVTNEEADSVLNIKDFRALRTLDKSDLLRSIQDSALLGSDAYDTAVWYEESVPSKSVVDDINWLQRNGMTAQVFCQKSFQLRDAYLKGLSHIESALFGTVWSALSRCKAPVIQLVFSGEEGSLLNYYRSIMNKSIVKKAGFRGKKVTFATVSDETFTDKGVVFTVAFPASLLLADLMTIAFFAGLEAVYSIYRSCKAVIDVIWSNAKLQVRNEERFLFPPLDDRYFAMNYPNEAVIRDGDSHIVMDFVNRTARRAMVSDEQEYEHAFPYMRRLIRPIMRGERPGIYEPTRKPFRRMLRLIGRVLWRLLTRRTSLREVARVNGTIRAEIREKVNQWLYMERLAMPIGGGQHLLTDSDAQRAWIISDSERCDYEEGLELLDDCMTVNTSAPVYLSALILCLALVVKLMLTRSKSVVSTSMHVAHGFFVDSPSATVVNTPQTVRRSIMALTRQPVAESSLGLSAVLATEALKLKEDKLTVSRNGALKMITMLLKTCRRFGVHVYDQDGWMTSFLVYNRQADARIANCGWATRERMSELLSVDVNDILPPAEWTINGAMITAQSWHGEYQYGQFERPIRLYQSLQGKLKSVVLFTRISDAPALRFDRFDSNSYVFPQVEVGTLAKYGLMFGESTGDEYVDLAKPYDSEILHDSGSIYTPWNQKQIAAIFRGGTTGSGKGPEKNVRDLLFGAEQAVENNSGVPCSFKVTSVSNRVTIDKEGVLSVRNERDYVVEPKMSYLDQGKYKIILVVEGHEAPDRTLLTMMTGSIVVYVNPTHCLGDKSWFEPFLIAGKTCLRVAASIDEISAALRWVNDNDEQASAIARRGHQLAFSLLDPEMRSSYMSNIISRIIKHETGSRTTINSVVQFDVKFRGTHSFIMTDTRLGYTHGTGSNMNSSAFRWQVLDCDIGCGITLYKMSLSNVLDFQEKCRTLKRGRDVYVTLQHLSVSEISRAESWGSPVLTRSDVHAVLKSVGTLGSGNHFVEVVYNNGEPFLLVHSGSRLAAEKALGDRLTSGESPTFDRSLFVCQFCEYIADMNRDVIARHFGVTEKVESLHHTRVLSDEECIQARLPEGNWFVKNLVFNHDSTLILGSPGTGVARLDGPPGLAPHGLGGQGSRTRDLENIAPNLWYQTVLRVGGAQWLSNPPELQTVATNFGLPSATSVINDLSARVAHTGE
ncbi:hypothetical polyprotein [viral metagenome]